MNLSERLPSGFELRDGLDARSAEQLASVAQVLERTLPLEEPQPSTAARERATRARAEREHQLGTALEQALPLLESSRYDIQVLVVLLRLRVEGGGLDGNLDAFEVLGRMLGDAWAGLAASLAERAAREQEKQRRKWARYVDAVLEQTYSWLARERERDERSLAVGLGKASPRWTAAFESIERGLAASALPVGRFDAVERAVRDLGRLAEAAERALGDAASAGAASGAARSERASVRPVPADSASGAPGDDGARGASGAGGANGAERVHDGARASDAGAALTELRVSERFWELERRLAAFDTLLARGEYEKAGIVESDLRESLEHFDVAAYFPGLFARYFEGCAAHAERLARHQPERGALRASALASLYRTDLERFLGLGSPSDRE